MIDGILDINGRGTCMNKCVFCPGRRLFAEASWDKIRKKADELLSVGAERFHIEGGDAGEWDQLPEMIEYLRDKGIKSIGLGTHGRTLKDRKLVQRLKDAGLISVNIPLYGSTEEIHNGITQSHSRSQGNAFQDTIQGIKNCAEVGIQTIFGHIGLTQSNKEDVVNILNLYVSLTKGTFLGGVDIVPLFVLIPTKLFTRDWFLPTKDMGPYLREAYQNCPPKVKLKIHQIPYCVFGSFNSVIDSRVLYAPHESLRSKRFSPSISKINTPTESTTRVAGYRRKSYFDECSHCSLKQQCIGLSTYELRLFGSSGLRAL